jgi:hypothetical protein
MCISMSFQDALAACLNNLKTSLSHLISGSFSVLIMMLVVYLIPAIAIVVCMPG